MLISEVDNLEATIARFWSHVDTSGDCWMWTIAINKGTGYGAFRIKRQGRRAGCDAHRFSYLLAHGEIPIGLQVCHDCDRNYPAGDITYRACVRPEHLWVGTQGDNIRDASHKGRIQHGDQHFCRRCPEIVRTFKRHRSYQGEDDPAAKLTTAQVEEIRARYACGGIRQVDLAAEYGVNQPHISRIIRGESWSHLPHGAGDVAPLLKEA